MVEVIRRLDLGLIKLLYHRLKCRKISSRPVAAAVRNDKCGKQFVTRLLDEARRSMKVTPPIVLTALWNESCGKENAHAST